MNIPDRVEPMDSVVDSIAEWNHSDFRQIYINTAKILRGKGFTLNQIEEILTDCYYAAVYNNTATRDVED